MTGHIRNLANNQFQIVDIRLKECPELISLYEQVRNALPIEHIEFVYPPRQVILDRVMSDPNRGQVMGVRETSSSKLVAGMVVEYPLLGDEDLGLAVSLSSEFQKASILRSYVTSPFYRKMGLGTALIQKWLSKAASEERPYCITEVVEGNSDSLKALAHSGLRILRTDVHPYDQAVCHLLGVNSQNPSQPIPNIFK